jgi:hypothetical protein
MTHVKTSPGYSWSGGKIERFHRTIQGDGMRTAPAPLLEGAAASWPATSSMPAAPGCTTPSVRLPRIQALGP